MWAYIICVLQLGRFIIACDNCRPGECTDSGDCVSCKEGHYLVDNACKPCLERCATCLQPGNCYSCIGGSYLYLEKCHRCPQNCANCKWYTRSTCDTCRVGYFGDGCRSRCSRGCRGGKCHKEDGRCTYGCFDGYYGNRCEFSCSEGCKNHTCDGNGHCMKGCSDGFYGRNCDLCLPTCASCTTSRTCASCKAGYFGSRCHYRCRNCKNNTCTLYGLCFYGCKVGYFLESGRCQTCQGNSSKCQFDVEVVPKPDSNTSCHHQNGTCKGGCVGDYDDRNCTIRQETNEAADDVGADVDVNRSLIIAACLTSVLILVIVSICTIQYRKRFKLRTVKHSANENVETPVQDENNEADNPRSIYYNTRAQITSSEVIAGTKEATTAIAKRRTTAGERLRNKERTEIGQEQYITYTPIDDIDIVQPSNETVNHHSVVAKHLRHVSLISGAAAKGASSVTELSTDQQLNDVPKEKGTLYMTIDEVSDDVVPPSNETMTISEAFAADETHSVIMPRRVKLAGAENFYESLQSKNERLYSSLE